MGQKKFITFDGTAYRVEDEGKHIDENNNIVFLGAIGEATDRTLLGQGPVVCIKGAFLSELDEQLPSIINDAYHQQQPLNRNASIVYFSSTQLKTISNHKETKIEYHYYAIDDDQGTNHRKSSTPGIARIAILDSPENCFISILDFYSIVKVMNNIHTDGRYATLVSGIKEYVNSWYALSAFDTRKSKLMHFR